MDLNAVQSRTEELLQLLGGRQRLLLLTHTNPDPDSLGSAMGLSLLAREACGLDSDFALAGRIMRAENKEMVRRLNGAMPMLPLVGLELAGYDCLAVVDTQPGFGHTTLPTGRNIDIVVDHHVGPDVEHNGHRPAFLDVRTQVGATSSMVTGYIIDAGIQVPTAVATALFYGIKTDTADLSRNVSSVDERAYEFLLDKLDREHLASISRPALPPAYFRALREALNNVRLYDRIVLCSLGKIDSSEMVAEVADLLLRLEHKDTVFCGGLVDRNYHISVRTEPATCDAYDLLEDALAGEGSFGGHGAVAGGSVVLPDDLPRTLKRLERRLEKNILRSLGVDGVPVAGLG
jgi:nanoRNase/pAp phosphatase (c-di-AMP/oligoRNAs hydrolase)